MILSGGRVIDATWTTDSEGIASTVVSEPTFRTLFVDNERRTLARYPKIDPVNEGKSFLYHGGQNPNLILSGLAKSGDNVAYDFTIGASGEYDLWLGIATTYDSGIEDWLKVSIDETVLAGSP